MTQLQPSQLRKLTVLAGGLLLVCLGLAWRLVDLQVVRHAELRSESDKKHFRQIRTSLRGDIVDAHGHLLATSLSVKTVVADLKIIGTNYPLVASLLAGPLGMTEGELRERMKPRTHRGSDGVERPLNSVVLKRKVPPATFLEVQRIMRQADPFPGRSKKELTTRQTEWRTGFRLRAIVSEGTDDQLRTYPGGSLMAHVLGYTRDEENERLDGRQVHELKGLAGIERSWDDVLRGTPGWRRGESIPKVGETPLYRQEDVAPRPGLDVVLTIDATVQHIVETEIAVAMERHNPRGVYALVVRPSTGEILAMASLPTFDPNRPGEFPLENLKNRIVSERFEPGSTFKTLTIAGALDDGVVRLGDVIHCENGQWHYGGHLLRDAGHRYGALSVTDVLAKSSNIGAAKIGIQAGAARVYDYVKRFGVLERTGISLPAEATGTVLPQKQWKPITVSRVPIGQGVDMTPLQVSMAVAALANRGRLMAPMLVRGLRDAEGREVVTYQPRMVRRVVSEETARLMVTAMQRVASTNGTGKSAQMDHHTVAGKTGTGQKPPYGSEHYFASFIGFFPATDPQVFISVFVDEPDRRRGYYGSETAAPVFRRIAERLAVQLGVPPDLGTPVVPSAPEITLSGSGKPAVSAPRNPLHPWNHHAAKPASP